MLCAFVRLQLSLTVRMYVCHLNDRTQSDITWAYISFSCEWRTWRGPYGQLTRMNFTTSVLRTSSSAGWFVVLTYYRLYRAVSCETLNCFDDAVALLIYDVTDVILRDLFLCSGVGGMKCELMPAGSQPSLPGLPMSSSYIDGLTSSIRVRAHVLWTRNNHTSAQDRLI